MACIFYKLHVNNVIYCAIDHCQPVIAILIYVFDL